MRIAAARGALEGVGGGFESKPWSRTRVTWVQVELVRAAPI